MVHNKYVIYNVIKLLIIIIIIIIIITRTIIVTIKNVGTANTVRVQS